MTSLFKVALLGVALLAVSVPAHGQTKTEKKSSNISKQITKGAQCPTLQEAGDILKLVDKRDALERVIKDAKSTGSRVCMDSANAAGTMLRDLMLATVRQDETEVCKIATNLNNQELLMKVTQVVYNHGGMTPCKIMTR